MRVDGEIEGFAAIEADEVREEADLRGRPFVVGATPLERLGTPSDVVEAVLYLARARYVTGQVLVIDGGRLIGPAPS